MIDGLEKTGYLVLGILDFANQEHVPLKFLARLLERQSWKMKPFLYENHICLLKYSKTAIHQNLSFDEKELHILEQLLEQYEYRIGVSNIFTELKRMKDAYAQAVFTLQWNQKTEQNTEVLCQYKDVVMYHCFPEWSQRWNRFRCSRNFTGNWPYMTESITLRMAGQYFVT